MPDALASFFYLAAAVISIGVLVAWLSRRQEHEDAQRLDREEDAGR